jgi:hypothetical protein
MVLFASFFYIDYFCMFEDGMAAVTVSFLGWNSFKTREDFVLKLLLVVVVAVVPMDAGGAISSHGE